MGSGARGTTGEQSDLDFVVEFETKSFDAYLLAPLSNLACHEHWVPEPVYPPEAEALQLDQLYAPSTSSTPTSRFFRTADLFRADVDLIFWDTTTVSFEVDAEDETAETRRGTTLPPLRKRGHSKESRDENPQARGYRFCPVEHNTPTREWTLDLTACFRTHPVFTLDRFRTVVGAQATPVTTQTRVKDHLAPGGRLQLVERRR